MNHPERLADYLKHISEVERCVSRARRLYEQQSGGAQPLARLGASVQRSLAVGASGGPADLVGPGDARHSF